MNDGDEYRVVNPDNEEFIIFQVNGIKYLRDMYGKVYFYNGPEDLENWEKKKP